MSEITFHDPCVIFTLRSEAAPFLREFRRQQRFPGAPCWARFCGPSWLTVLVLQTGAGAEAVGRALDWLLGKPLLGNVPYRPRLVLSAGFSVALEERFQVGDIVLASDVIDESGIIQEATWPGELPAGEWRPPIHRGRLLAMPRVIGDPKEKRALGERYCAAAMERESAALASRCSRHGIPFGCLRAISDRVDMPLSPQMVRLLSGGGVYPWRLTAAVLRSPGLMSELWLLAKHTRLAARALGMALGELLTLTLPGGREL